MRREALDVLKLAQALVLLSDAQLSHVPLDDDLLAEVRRARAVTQQIARKRQIAVPRQAAAPPRRRGTRTDSRAARQRSTAGASRSRVAASRRTMARSADRRRRRSADRTAQHASRRRPSTSSTTRASGQNRAGTGTVRRTRNESCSARCARFSGNIDVLQPTAARVLTPSYPRPTLFSSSAPFSRCRSANVRRQRITVFNSPRWRVG